MKFITMRSLFVLLTWIGLAGMGLAAQDFVIIGDDEVCSNAANPEYSLTLPATADFEAWIVTGATTTFESSELVIVMLGTNNFTITYTITSGDSSMITTQSVTVNTAPSVSLLLDSDPAGATESVCVGNSHQLIADVTEGDAGITNYNWFNADDTDDQVTLPTANANSNTYNVMVTDGNGCSATSSNVTVNVIDLPDASITVLENSGPASGNQVCLGDAVSLQAPAGLSYLWEDIGGNDLGTQQTLDVANSLPTNGAPVTFSLEVSAGPGCVNNSEVTIDGLLLPETIIIDGGGNPVTDGEVFFTENSTSSEPGSTLTDWEWDFGPSADPASTLVNNVNTTVSTIYSTSGNKTIELMVTDDNNCKNSTTFQKNITAGMCFISNINNSTGSNRVCVGEEVEFQPIFTVSPGATGVDTWTWTIAGASSFDPTAERPIAIFNTPGDFQITAIFRDNSPSPCSTEDSPTIITITVLAAPEPQLIAPTQSCEGTQIDIPVTGASVGDLLTVDGFAYQVSQSPQGGNQITVPPRNAGQNTFRLTRAVSVEGCESDALDQSITVDVNSSPAISIVTEVPCIGGQLTLNTVLESTGQSDGLSQFRWFTGGNPGNSIPNSNGVNPLVVSSFNSTDIYRVTAQDVNGCISEETATVTPVSQFTPIISGEIEVCRNQSNLEYFVTNQPNGSELFWSVSGGTVGNDGGNPVSVNWGDETGAGSVSVMVELTPNVANDECSFNASLPVTISPERAQDTTEVYLVSQTTGAANYFLVAATESQCYQWGNAANEGLPLGTARSYFPGSGVSLDEIVNGGYFVKTWTGNCSSVPECVTRSNFRPRPQDLTFPASLSIQSHPNPARDWVAIDIAAPSEHRYFEVSIHDLRGRTILTQTLENTTGNLNHELTVAQLVSGYYVLRVTDALTGHPWVKPLIIAR